MYYVVEIACVITEMWMIHMFLGCFFERQSVLKWLLLILYFICGAILTVLSLIEGMVYGRILFTTASVLTASMILFKARPLYGLISGVAFCAILYLHLYSNSLEYRMKR